MTAAGQVVVDAAFCHAGTGDGKVAAGLDGEDSASHVAPALCRKHRLQGGRKIGMIFQEPMTVRSKPSLTRLGEQLDEWASVAAGADDGSNARLRARAGRCLDRVGIFPNGAHEMRQYPHQLSAEQRQRVMIAIWSLMLDTEVAESTDEATTALDVTVQAQIHLRYLARSVRRERGWR